MKLALGVLNSDVGIIAKKSFDQIDFMFSDDCRFFTDSDVVKNALY